MSKNKKQFSLTWLVRILLATLIVVSIGVFANSVMQYNALLDEQQALEEQHRILLEKKEEMQEMLSSGFTKEEIIEYARKYWGLYLPEEEIFITE